MALRAPSSKVIKKKSLRKVYRDHIFINPQKRAQNTQKKKKRKKRKEKKRKGEKKRNHGLWT